MAKPLGPTCEFFKRRDEWQKHPMMTKQWRHATPGLGIALVAFGIYVGHALSKIVNPKLITNFEPKAFHSVGKDSDLCDQIWRKDRERSGDGTGGSSRDMMTRSGSGGRKKKW
ncbi:NADH dehydrogenase [ubiquinone] 1 beta subcomplex subunit 3-B [Forsythia ovata]|uniref:NADH dehydrogenase [ubiquinone] 1 beta subcomplex subunit 3-B n=1 Tax=Forsythia ovata TaxID=205694 RepID=A0ABD1TC32_9LAMI